MQSVLNALRVLEEVAARQPVGVSELARGLELPKSSVQRVLQTLHVAGWIRPDGGEPTRWVVTTRAMSVGRHAASEIGVRDAALPVMRELRDRTEETVHLVVPEGNTVVLIERVDSTRVVRTIHPLGGHAPIHATSNGKAILAHLPAEEVEKLMVEGLRRYTDATITDPAELLAELADVRRRGYAVNAREWRDDVAAVGAAIRDHRERPVASISVSMPAHRMTDELRPVYGDLVVDGATRISNALA